MIIPGSFGWRGATLAAAFAVCAACGRAPASSTGAAPATGAAGGRGSRGGRGGVVAVQSTTVQRITVQREVDLSGTLLSPDQAKVSSEVAGRVNTVSVELGSEVKVGDVLVRLEPRELTLALERADSALRQVEAQLGIQRDQPPPPDEQIASVRQAIASRDDARAAYARAQRLSGLGVLSQVDKDTADTRLKVADANYEAAVDTARSLKASLQDRRASNELAQKKVNDAAIKAPVAGSISERLVQPGEYIRENTQVATIVQMHPLKLRTGVQEKFAGQISPGQAVRFTVEAFPTQAFEGRVAFVSPAVDQATRTFVIEALVNNNNRQLKPGFFAKGTISINRDDNVMAVSDDAVSTMAGVSTVFVIEDGKVRPQIVSLGVHQDGAWEIVDGLKGPETLAASNLNQLASGGAVRIGRDGDAGAGPASENPSRGERGPGRADGGQR